VLIHGGASDCRDWLATMPALSNRFTLYAPDLIGFGHSERKAEGYYLTDFIEFIEEFTGRLGLDRPALVGHSLGGRICMGAALRDGKNYRKLVLIDAAGLGRVTRFGSSLMTFFWGLRQAVRRPQPYPRFRTREGEDHDWLCIEELPAVKTPTLIIWKRRDPYLPLEHALRAKQLIPGARLEILEGYGHAPHGQNSGAFTRALGDFLAEE
jgi:pimeloyl-ACP methyl ester carboxylesterase